MPEGPEIRLEADRIAAAVEGHRLDEVFFAHRHLRHFQDVLTGLHVTGVSTRGKAMLTSFSNDLVLYSHNQLYGRWYTTRNGELPRTNRSLRVALHTAAGSALLYSASEIDVLRYDELEQHPFLQRLGPDALDEAVHWRDLAARLAERRFCRRTLHALLLDQGFVAGIGNYLRSEILWFAALPPACTPADLTVKARNELARQILGITRRAYATRGVTNTPAQVKRLKRDGARRGVYRFTVFARAGKPCYRCGKKIRRDTLSGRRLYWCAGCQRQPG